MLRSGTRLLHGTWSAHGSPASRFLGLQKNLIKHSAISRPGNLQLEVRWGFRVRQALNDESVDQTATRRPLYRGSRATASDFAEALFSTSVILTLAHLLSA